MSIIFSILEIMSLIKTVKTDKEEIKFFSTNILGSEKVVMNGKVYYIMKTPLTFNDKEINRKNDDGVDVHEFRSKKCTNCGIEKKTKDFYRDSSKSIGYSNRCKQCWKLINDMKK